jgi:hypothetical protein
MSFTPASPPPPCFEDGHDACPAACIDAAAPPSLRGVCGNGCAALLAAPPRAVPGRRRCHALAGAAAGNVTVAPLDASRPGDGLLFTFASGDASGCGADAPPGGRTLAVAVRCSTGGPLAPALLPASVTTVGECAYATAMTHPSACPFADPLTHPFVAPDPSAPPKLYWEKERRYIERHVGADEVYEHFSLRLRNDGGGSLLASFFALRDANFVRFTPPALALAPGEAGMLDVKVPSRFVSATSEVKIQTNGGEGAFWLDRADWPASRHPEMAPATRQHTQAVALLAALAAAAACSAGVAPRARRHAAAAARAATRGDGDASNSGGASGGGGGGGCGGGGGGVDWDSDDGEGGVTGRRRNRSRRGGASGSASGSGAAAHAHGDADNDEEDAELAAAYAASAGLASELESCIGTNGPSATSAAQQDDAAWLMWAAERAAAKAAALEAGAAEMGAVAVADVAAAACGAAGAAGASTPIPDDAASFGAGSASPHAPSAAEVAERQLRCVVCLSAPKDTVLVPCRHLSTCLACTRRLAAAPQPLHCPVCRKRSTDFLQLFL